MLHRPLKGRPLARVEGKERPLNADGGRTRWRWRASFKVQAYLRTPLFDFSPPRMEARVFYVTLRPLPEKSRRRRTGEKFVFYPHVEYRVEGVRPSVDSNSRVIKFLQFKFLPPISRPPTEKLDVMIYRGWSEENSHFQFEPASYFLWKLPTSIRGAAVVKILGEVWTKCTAMRTPSPPLSLSLVEDWSTFRLQYYVTSVFFKHEKLFFLALLLSSFLSFLPLLLLLLLRV